MADVPPLDFTKRLNRTLIQSIGRKPVHGLGRQPDDATFHQSLNGTVHDVSGIIGGTQVKCR